MRRLAFINFIEISYVFGSARLNPKRKDVIQKQRHYFANNGPSSQGYGFSSGHVWM